MPTYDYRCSSCDHEFELFQSMSDKPKRKCPDCGKMALERLIGTGAGVIFKGGGFYETDYRSESYKKGAESDKKASESKSDDKKAGAKSESSNTKAESKPKETAGSGKSSDKKPKK